VPRCRGEGEGGAPVGGGYTLRYALTSAAHSWSMAPPGCERLARGSNRCDPVRIAQAALILRYLGLAWGADGTAVWRIDCRLCQGQPPPSHVKRYQCECICCTSSAKGIALSWVIPPAALECGGSMLLKSWRPCLGGVNFPFSYLN